MGPVNQAPLFVSDGLYETVVTYVYPHTYFDNCRSYTDLAKLFCVEIWQDLGSSLQRHVDPGIQVSFAVGPVPINKK